MTIQPPMSSSPHHITPPRPTPQRPGPTTFPPLNLSPPSSGALLRGTSSLTVSSDSSRSPFTGIGSKEDLSGALLSAGSADSIFAARILTAVPAPHVTNNLEGKHIQFPLGEQPESPSKSPYDLLMNRGRRAATEETDRLPSSLLDRSGSDISPPISARAAGVASQTIPMNKQPSSPFADVPHFFQTRSMYPEYAAEPYEAGGPPEEVSFADRDGLRQAVSEVFIDFNRRQQERIEGDDLALAKDFRKSLVREKARKTIEEFEDEKHIQAFEASVREYSRKETLFYEWGLKGSSLPKPAELSDFNIWSPPTMDEPTRAAFRRIREKHILASICRVHESPEGLLGSDEVFQWAVNP